MLLNPLEGEKEREGSEYLESHGARSNTQASQYVMCYCSQVFLPETVCDGGVLLNIYRQVQEVFVFTAHLDTDRTLVTLTLNTVQYQETAPGPIDFRHFKSNNSLHFGSPSPIKSI